MVSNKVVSFDLDGTLTDSSFVDSVWHEGIPRLYSIKKKVSLGDAKKAVKYCESAKGNTDIQPWKDYIDGIIVKIEAGEEKIY